MLTPSDLQRNSTNTGYAHVYAGNSSGAKGHGGGKPFYAHKGFFGSNSPQRMQWRGPRRATAPEAAQDYCDYMNSGKAPAPKPRTVAAPKPPSRLLRRANHPVRSVKTKASQNPRPYKPVGERHGFVYLIGIEEHSEYVKVGWSSKAGFPRLAELQTGNPLLLVGVAEIPGTLRDEYKLHTQFEPYNVLGEWFEASPDLLSEFDLEWNEFASAVNDIYAINLKEAV